MKLNEIFSLDIFRDIIGVKSRMGYGPRLRSLFPNLQN